MLILKNALYGKTIFVKFILQIDLYNLGHQLFGHLGISINLFGHSDIHIIYLIYVLYNLLSF